MTDNLFCYGILKRGFALDLTQHGGKFVSEARIDGARLYAIGGGVGLRFSDCYWHEAHGELFEIDPALWKWLDGIESNGFCYTRIQTPVVLLDGSGREVTAFVYEHTYPGMEYTDENWIKDGIFRG